ncbi:hypothetical protein MPSEU_000425700 [Mayamaea pseudoterrestris]|nr:hypothetical protein MPSEU_000425700 [Mayamaea pseudoterrestris]
MSKDSSISSITLLKGRPPFYESLHVSYIEKLVEKMDVSMEGAVTEHLRMSGVYWSLAALHILREPYQVDALMGFTFSKNGRQPILDWVFDCFDTSTGSFAGNCGQDGHLLYTLSALQILALHDKLSDPRLDKEKVIQFIGNLQQPDGSFAGDSWGEIDTRFSYCALSALSILGALNRISLSQAVNFVLQCRNLDGGFGAVVGAESHAGQVFCCVGALAIAGSLDKLKTDDIDLLGWWLSERQVDSGGLNGRPEKQADVCYSWWILSVLSIMGQVDWISRDKLASFILKCQDGEDGGVADRPDDAVDVFHTFFGVAGLSLLGHLHVKQSASSAIFRRVDPVYALPIDVVRRLALPAKIVAREKQLIDERLHHYDVYYYNKLR